jgi:hypothetical protein
MIDQYVKLDIDTYEQMRAYQIAVEENGAVGTCWDANGRVLVRLYTTNEDYKLLAKSNDELQNKNWQLKERIKELESKETSIWECIKNWFK